MKTEESTERLTNTPLPDDHSGYTVQDYVGQEVEVESTAITLGETQFLALSRVESVVCAKPTVSAPKRQRRLSGPCRQAGREEIEVVVSLL